MTDIPEVVEVSVVGDYELLVRFDDGVSGIVDFSGHPFHGVFARWRDPAEFARVRVDPESGTIVWPWGVDTDPIVLHSAVTGEPIDTGEGLVYGVDILNGSLTQ